MRASSSKKSKGSIPLIVFVAFGGLAAYQLMTSSSPAERATSDMTGSDPPAATADGVNATAETSIPNSNPAPKSSGDATMRTETPRGIVHADAGTFEQEVLQSEVPVLVDFYADWCGPCQMLAPTLETLARETSHAKIVKVNVDHNPELARQYRVSSIPTLLVFDGGKVTGEHVGLAGKSQLESLLAR